MSSRALRSKAKIKVIPTRSYSASLRGSKQKEPFLSLDSTKKTTPNKEKTTRGTRGRPPKKQVPSPKAEKEKSSNEQDDTMTEAENIDFQVIKKEPDVKEEPQSKFVDNESNNVQEVTQENHENEDSNQDENQTHEGTVSEEQALEGTMNEEEPSKSSPKELTIVPPLKRKRGRPRKTEFLQTDTVENIAKKPKTERVPTPPVVIKEEQKPISPEPPRRKPRMASLNALAKVNAVLDIYRFEKLKDIIDEQSSYVDTVDIKKEKEMKSNNKKQEKTDKIDVKIESKTVCETREMKAEEVTVIEDEEEEDYEEVFVCPSPDPPTPPPEMITQSIQTENIHHCKSVQTERVIFVDNRSTVKTLCTCYASNKKNELKHQHVKTNFTESGFPIHIRSTVLAHTPSYTVALPIVKTHKCPRTENTHNLTNIGGITANVTSMLDRCISRTLFQHNYYPECTKLAQMSAQKKAIEKQKRLAELAQQRIDQKKNAERLVIPSLHCEPISISIPTSDNYQNDITNKQVAKKSYKKKTKEKVQVPVKKQESIDTDEKAGDHGWRFEGAHREENTNVGREIVRRRYFPMICRDRCETIRVYDAVVLKSDDRDSGYVARISSFWEDNKGPYKGEMMMSVQWYYKPTQTISKGNDIICGDEMEVFASRHKDDNSVACIIDRCYVITLPQYNRYKAHKQRWEEKRHRKLVVVPEVKNHRSRLLPSPDFDPSLVYFCRFGYDYRSGKLIKSTYY